MKGTDYEQLVRAVLIRKLKWSPEDLKSTKEHGATLPGGPELKHQIDLFYVDTTEVAEYLTIIECKWRSDSKVDQKLLAHLAFVKNSMKASKAIMVSNVGFTEGAHAVADAEKIALIWIVPDKSLEDEIASIDTRDSADDLFGAILTHIRARPTTYQTVVVRRFSPDPNDKGLDLVNELLSDPNVRNEVERLAKDPEVRKRAADFLQSNPEIERKARDLLGGRGGGLF